MRILTIIRKLDTLQLEPFHMQQLFKLVKIFAALIFKIFVKLR